MVQAAVDDDDHGVHPRLDAAEGFSRLGRIRHRAGDHLLAEIAFRQAALHARSCGSKHEEARALQELGVLAASAGDLDEARRRWIAALELYRASGSADGSTVAEALARLPASQ
ncbi:tetratricopeptide repeat protein [Actinosynnema sp. CA-299493]